MKLVCVLGMHRSGTSCLAGSLQEAGLFISENAPLPGPDNLKGYQENLDITGLNDAVLQFSGGTWSHPPNELSWTSEQAAHRDRTISHLSTQLPLTLFKDPRTLINLPFWEDSRTRFFNIGTFRHPLKVALSLNHRNRLPIKTGLELWSTYNRKLLEAFDKSAFPLICFDLSPENYLDATQHIVRTLQEQFPQAELSVEASKKFYTPKLDHYPHLDAWFPNEDQHKTDVEVIWQSAHNIYQELLTAAGLGEVATTHKNDTSSYSVPLSRDAKACQQLILQQPNNPYVWPLLAQQHESASEVAEAIAAYRRAIAVDASNYWNYQQLGALLQSTSDYSGQVELYQQALESVTDQPFLYYHLAQAQQKAEESEAAIASYHHMLEHIPDHVNSWIGLGDSWRLRDDNEKAIEAYRQAIKCAPQRAGLYMKVAQLLQQRPEEALLCFQQAVALEPTNVRFLIVLGNHCLFRLKRIEEAITTFQRALEVDHDNADIYHRLAIAFLRQDDYAAAFSYISTAQLLAPESPEIHAMKGNISRRRGDMEDAIKAFEKAIELNYNKSFNLYKSLGEIYNRLDNSTLSIKAYRQAMNLNPYDTSIHQAIENLESS